MSHNFVEGDVVRIGKGKVEYTVTNAAGTDEVEVSSNNTERKQIVSVEKLTMVKATNHIVTHASVEDIDNAIVQGEQSFETFGELMDKVDALNIPVDEEASQRAKDVIKAHEEVSWDLAVKDIAATLPLGTFVITDDDAPREFKSFEAAAFALSRDHIYSRAVIVRDNVIKATR